VVDEKKNREDSFQKSLNVLVPTSEGDKKRVGEESDIFKMVKMIIEESDIFKMVKMIIMRQYDPVILFNFSKRECELLARWSMLLICYMFQGANYC